MGLVKSGDLLPSPQLVSEKSVYSAANSTVLLTTAIFVARGELLTYFIAPAVAIRPGFSSIDLRT